MAYESKIFIVEKQKGATYYDKIAMLDLCCMGYNNQWDKLFDKELEASIYFEGRKQKTDKYGEKLKYATFEEVVAWCERVIDSDLLDYRRFKLLKNLLSSIDTKLWDSLIIIHYGY